MSKFYKLTVTMKHGFVYSVFCGAKQLEGMKRSSDGYWTDKVEVTEVTPEDYQKAWWEETLETTEAPQKKSRKKKLPQFSTVEDFFEEPTKRKKK
jgi:hypothetical protein